MDNIEYAQGLRRGKKRRKQVWKHMGRGMRDYFFDTSKNYRNMHKLPKATIPFSDPTKMKPTK